MNWHRHTKMQGRERQAALAASAGTGCLIAGCTAAGPKRIWVALVRLVDGSRRRLPQWVARWG
jgi:hypothetical protein